ncbi:nitrate reductase cytochrome c-type subunit [Nitrogeniibacter mangrovi]|uniref:Periplasmic nitrate reductase, electron transfer subunit n=1 Tax=Nitrogeniibacter mangrovi TaxID=2016596 RepID=A0A6C1B7J6_9RHOO|nr:nitrate reductase cytochrome c-type subunit [Nitrogeniibacter mangrovi]QID19447.1 nitrate reductase cytochrome c-type subunit [Nitrogeniibacter mangrovi]
MNNKTRQFFVAALMAASLGTVIAAQAAGAVESLRGRDVETQSREPGKYATEKDGPPIERNYVQQPPLIPHKIDGYSITTNFNKCMDCHSWTRYRETGATKVSLTHFKDRDGKELSNISPRRYFCNQCHVPQTDAKPLVENTFKKAEGLR